MKRQCWWTVPLGLPLLLACGSGGEAQTETKDATGDRVATVRTIELRPQVVSDIATFSADLLPEKRATLAAEVAGAVEELTVELGERVARGQLLVRIDTRALQQQLAEAEALYLQAEDRFQRAERLFEKRSITKEQHIDAVAARDVAEARLASARLALEKSEVKAPWQGRVAAKLVEVGDYAAPGQPLVNLVAVDRLKVRAAVPAADVRYLRRGTPVQVSFDVLPGELFEGAIVRLGAELDPDTRTLTVEAEIDNRAGRLRPGLFGRMEVPRQVLPRALLIPLVAVVDFESEQVVYVVRDGVAWRRVVELGPVVGERVVVTGGLEAGERVIIAGQQLVADGQRVAEAEGA